jgi:hypothetical protein
MVAIHYPWGIVVEGPSAEGSALFLRSLGEAKLADVSLMADHEVLLVEFIATNFPEVLRLFHAETQARRGLLLSESPCLSPGAA